MSEILATLTDYRERVLQADKLRLQGDKSAAEKLMPTREEMLEAIKAYRASLGQRSTKRAESSESKAKAAAIATMENLSDLFKS